VRAQARRARLLRCAGLIGCLALGSGATSGGRNNYYSYTDDQGVIHVTNVPERREGAWRLWKSLEGSGTDLPRAPAVRRGGESDTDSEERERRYDAFIRGAAQRYQLPESLIRAVIRTESNFYPKAVSRAGAMGLMQLMPRTATSLGVEQAFDPMQNIYGGTRYLRLLANRYDGDMILVLAAYNAGAGNVEKYGGVPPFEETRAYVRAVLQRFYGYERKAAAHPAGVRPGPARHVAP